MVNEEDLVSNGDITCDGVGWGKPQPCLEPEFCNGVNSTCPIVGGTSVEFTFGLSTDSWTHISVKENIFKYFKFFNLFNTESFAWLDWL